MEPETPTKQCIKCLEVLPATKEFFHASNKYLSSRCKKCKNQQTHEIQSTPEFKERRRERLKERFKDPEVRERKNARNRKYFHKSKDKIKSYLEKPEVKERRRELKRGYASDPKYKEQHKLYLQREDVKESIRTKNRERYRNDEKYRQSRLDYNHRPEQKLARKEYDKEYKARPEVKERINKQKWERSQTPKYKFSQYKTGAETRGLAWNLNEEEFLAFWGKSCTYCGATIETIGLDRVENSQGYFVSNIVSCCPRCNRAKSNMSKDEWLGFIGRIHEHYIEVREYFASQGVSLGA